MSSNQGKIIELYGGEGVGKTELALLYVARICLPCEWNGHHLNGRGAKVVFVDTEYKFSILHLAIIMEQIILQYINNGISIDNNSSVKTKHIPESHNASKQDNLLNAVLCKPGQSSHDCVNKDTISGQNSCTDSKNSQSKSKLTVQNNLLNTQDKNLSNNNNDLLKKDLPTHTSANSPLSVEDVEKIVHDSLGRLQVFRVSCTSELTATLLSLNTTLTSDPLLSLVVVDAISAYYWIDKTLSADTSQCTESSMAPIANIITKQVAEFGVTYLTIKSALIGQKRKWITDIEHSRNNSDSSKAESAFTDHVEFLGRSWSRLNLRRVIVSQKTVNGKKCVIASCSDWQEERIFSFVDDLLQIE